MKVSQFQARPGAPSLPASLSPDDHIEEYLMSIANHGMKVQRTTYKVSYRGGFRLVPNFPFERRTYSDRVEYPWVFLNVKREVSHQFNLEFEVR
ncbi:MAG: hypothetical protein AAGG02_01090 [Cyanobacteria bacterium P01_H01_bin.15]